MITIESILYGVLGGLLGMKVFLLGLAAVLFIYTLKEHNRQRRMASTRVPAQRFKVDIHV